MLGTPDQAPRNWVLLMFGMNHETLLEMFRGGFLVGRAAEAAQNLLKVIEEEKARGKQPGEFPDEDGPTDDEFVF